MITKYLCIECANKSRPIKDNDIMNEFIAKINELEESTITRHTNEHLILMK